MLAENVFFLETFVGKIFENKDTTTLRIISRRKSAIARGDKQEGNMLEQVSSLHDQTEFRLLRFLLYS